MHPTKRYVLLTALLCLLGIPVLLQLVGFVGMYAGMLLGENASLIVAGLCTLLALFFVWLPVAKWKLLPEEALWRYMPILLSFAWYMLAFIVPFALARHRFGSIMDNVMMTAALPWFVVNLLLHFTGAGAYFPAIQIAVHALSALFLTAHAALRHRAPFRTARALPLLCGALLLCALCGLQFYLRGQSVLSADFDTLKIEDEVNLYDYAPFEGRLLYAPEEPPSLSIASDYPRLDGATAAYPVYASMAQAIYKGLDAESIAHYVACTTTATAYERLIAGEADIFFGAQPSAQQIRAAADQGVEFHLTPIAREAFVFFVHKDNPVSELSLAQVQDIYQKKITGWQVLGGRSEAIIPFQRPQGSGSQTIMERVMGDKALPEPLVEEYAAGMGGVISAVASYRNYAGAIGYSFRFFATGMKPSEEIKLLSLEGAAPTIENIRSGLYPLSVEVYAVTTRQSEGNTEELIDWILSDEGQRMIEACGYVAI